MVCDFFFFNFYSCDFELLVGRMSGNCSGNKRERERKRYVGGSRLWKLSVYFL